MLYDRLDLLLVRAVSEEAHAQHLPLAMHTGDARDVADAVEIGSASVEHGSLARRNARSLLERMAKRRCLSRPDTGVAEAYALYFGGKPDVLNIRSSSRWCPARMLKGTRAFVTPAKGADGAQGGDVPRSVDKAAPTCCAPGRPASPGDGYAMPAIRMVFHGPSLHHELRLWVEAGIPVDRGPAGGHGQRRETAGRARKSIGAIRPGMEADLLLVDGNPLEEIAATERISLVVFKGERIRRSKLFEQK